MSLKTILVIGFAIGSAAMTGLYAHNWLSAQRSAVQAHVEPDPEPAIALVEVLVATQDLPVGSFVRPESLTWEAWPENVVKEGYAIAGATTPDDFSGAVVRSRVLAGEPLKTAQVVHPGERGFLAAVLTPGLRAVSVPVDAASGIAGFVFPGDRVDVLLSYRINQQNEESPAGNTRHFSQTMLRGVRVLAVDQIVDNDTGAAMLAKTVTLEVDQKQAEKLALGMDLGTLSLSLRSLRGTVDGVEQVALNDAAEEDDDAPSFTQDLDVMYMLGSTPVGNPANVQPRSVDVLRGAVAEKVVF
jgi:pilus assembly protein CpaB